MVGSYIQFSLGHVEQVPYSPLHQKVVCAYTSLHFLSLLSENAEDHQEPITVYEDDESSRDSFENDMEPGMIIYVVVHHCLG